MKARAPLLAVATVCALGVGWWSWSRPPSGSEQECGAGEVCQVPVAQNHSSIPQPSTASARTEKDSTPIAPADRAAADARAGSPPEPGDSPDPSANTASTASDAKPIASSAELRETSKQYWAQGDIASSLEALRLAVATEPNDPINQGELGAMLVQLTAFDDGLVHLRRAADLDPNNADRWIALANGYYRKVEPGSAWAAEKRAREVESGLVLGWGTDGLRIRVGGAPIAQP